MSKGQPEKGYALTPYRQRVLSILAKEGPLTDEAGLVVGKLRERTGHRTTQALSGVIKSMEDEGLIRREMSGRRTYRLELVPGAIAPEDWATIGLEPADAAPPALAVVPPSEPADEESVLDRMGDDPDWDALAASLLKEVVRSVRRREDDDPQLRLKLLRAETAVAEQKRRIAELEGQLRERGSELFDLQAEMRKVRKSYDDLAKKLAHAEARPSRGSSKIGDLIGGETKAELAKLMRQRPTAKG